MAASNKPLISINSLSLLFAGHNFKEKCAHVRNAGFGGIEYTLFHPEHVSEYRSVARTYGLLLTLHQPWSYQESGGMLSNMLFAMLGVLPKDGYLLDDIAIQAAGENFVVYGDRFPEITMRKILPGALPRFTPLFQTASAWTGSGLRRKPRISYEGFIRYVIKGLPEVGIVYDTVHALELALHAPTSKELMQFSEQKLLETTKRVIEEIGFFEGRGREIHFNDLSGHGTDGRCLAGDGKLTPALQWLAGECLAHDWRSPVIPEVSPMTFLFDTEMNLRLVRERVESFFV